MRELGALVNDVEERDEVVDGGVKSLLLVKDNAAVVREPYNMDCN